jgi:hypothetical protein
MMDPKYTGYNGTVFGYKAVVDPDHMPIKDWTKAFYKLPVVSTCNPCYALHKEFITSGKIDGELVPALQELIDAVHRGEV